MTDRFPRYAAWLFGIAVPVAAAVVLLAPIPFMRGLGIVALTCATLGVAVNALALRSLQRKAYWPVGATMARAGLATTAAMAAATPPAPFMAARSRVPRRTPRLSFARVAHLPRALVLFPARQSGLVTSHA